MKWPDSPHWLAYDCESTGTSVHEDQIVTAAIVHAKPGERPRTVSWVMAPTIPIPTEASDVHGWTPARLDEHLNGAEARKAGQPYTRAQALFEIAGQIALAMSNDVPVVAMNASFDLSMLEAECRRNDVPTLAERLAPKGITGVIDPAVLDKQWDPYRKACYRAPGCQRDADPPVHECGGCRGGKYACGGCGSTNRRLTSLCAHYGVMLGDAHSADADALAALRVTKKIAGLWPDVARLKLATVHSHQVGWAKDQATSLAAFFNRIGEHEKASSVCGSWPVHGDCCRMVAGVAS